MIRSISVDMMGGDYGFRITYPSVLKFLKDNPDWKVIGYVLKGTEIPADKPASLEIREADSIIKSDASAMVVARNKDNTLSQSIIATIENNSSATVSAGASGPLTTAAYILSRPISDSVKPAFAPIFSSVDEEPKVILDVGANLDVNAETLVSFAKMGSIFYKAFTGMVEAPKVGLLNIGIEEMKGDTLRVEAFKSLSDANVNFVGNVEPDNMLTTQANVLVTDAFTGNIALKTIEGVLKNFGNQVKKTTKSPLGALGLMLAKKDLKKNLKGITQKGQAGGAVILGINHLVLKVHGGATQDHFVNALETAKRLVEKNLISTLKDSIK